MSAQAEHIPGKCIVTRLKNRRDFVRLRTGKRYSTPHMTVQSGLSDDCTNTNACRVGFTVTTKVGNAVERNRIKRRLRCLARNVFSEKGHAGHDYALVAKRKCLGGSYKAMVDDLKQALDHLHANRAKGSKRHGITRQ